MEILENDFVEKGIKVMTFFRAMILTEACGDNLSTLKNFKID